jgi:replicative DNA helicase
MDTNKEFDTSVDTLAKYGATFQIKTVVALLGSQKFLAQVYDVINPHYFENEAAKWIVRFLLKYYGEYKTVPSMEVFATELQKSKDDNLIYVSVRDLLRDVYLRIKTDTDMEYVQNEFLEFCKNQTLKTAILRSVDLLQSGQYSQIKATIDKAMHAGISRDLGHDYTDIDARLKIAARDVIPTGWTPVDNIIDGGLASGELGVIVAPSGIGKSWILSTIGANAIKRGKTVIHYTMELNEHYVGVRYDTIFTGIEPALMRQHYDEVKEAVSKIPGHIRIKYYPAKGSTVHTLESHLEQLLMVGFKPDLIIVDYADLMRSIDKADNKYEEQGSVYQELRGMAGEYKLPIWTASQSQRSAIQEEIIQADKIAESYQKIMNADFVMSASRTLEDKAKNEGRIHIIKNRFGIDGITYKMYMHTGMGLVKVVEPNSAEDLALKQRIGHLSSAPSVVTAKAPAASEFLQSVYRK